jgi:hypothetical protein
VKLTWWWFNWWKVPRVFVTAVSLGVFVPGVVSVFARTVDFYSGPFVWLGCFLMLRAVWTKALTWAEFLRMPVFCNALALMIAGNVIWSLRH